MRQLFALLHFLRSCALWPSSRRSGQWVERPLWGMARSSRMRRCFSRRPGFFAFRVCCCPSPCYLHLRLLPHILLFLASLIPSVLPLLPHPVVLPPLCSAGWVDLVAVFSLPCLVFPALICFLPLLRLGCIN